jgi:hypothetical protein
VDSAFENVQIFSPEQEPALFFGGWGNATVPGALWLPAGILITDDPALLSYFDKIRHKDFIIKYLILVTNQFGPPYLNIYAFGDARPGTPLETGDVDAYEKEQEDAESGDLPQEVGDTRPEE